MAVVPGRTRRPVGRALLGVAVLALVGVAAPTGAAQAIDVLEPVSPPATVAADPLVELVARTAGISTEEAAVRVERQPALVELGHEIDGVLGARGGGSWLDQRTGALHTGVLDEAAAATARAMGAVPVPVTRSTEQLTAIKLALDEYARDNGSGRAVSWGIDPVSNVVDVTVAEGTDEATTGFLAAARAHGSAVRVTPMRGEVRNTELDLRGGDPVGCTAGFNVRDLVTQAPAVLVAGHCLLGPDTMLYTTRFGAPVGYKRLKFFPTSDHGTISNLNPGIRPRGHVTTYGTPGVPDPLVVRDVAAVLPNTFICKAGLRAGFRCGVVSHLNETVAPVPGVIPGGGFVYGQVRHNACVRPGDSGGSVVLRGAGAVAFALGVNTAGFFRTPDDQCYFGDYGVSWYQPIVPALEQNGVSLMTE